VLCDGQLALIDFGSVGRLDPLLDLAQAPRLQATSDDLLERTLAQFIAQHLGRAWCPTPPCSPPCSGCWPSSGWCSRRSSRRCSAP